MNPSIKRALTVVATTVLVAGTALAGSPKHMSKTHAAKFTPSTFVCQHGCKKKITVKTEADMKKTCPVCGCKKTIAQCMPSAKKAMKKKMAKATS